MAFCLKHKFLLNCCNFLFLTCGTLLIISGFYLFTDTKRILLSRLLAATSDQLNNLPQPLFYYISIGLAVAGLIAVLAAIMGFWASCLNTYCCLSLYFLAVVVLLLAESVACLAITLWPHCLGISLDESKMVKALQGNYGVPGKEQFTIAMDLAQTRFGCCGMNSEINYDTSMWRLQGYGQRDWAVPLTCCVLQNSADKLSYLDPKPANETQCQMLQKSEYERFRYTDTCLNYLDNWYREQYVVFLGASLIIAVIEFCVLLCIILNCTKITRKSVEVDSFLEMRTRTKSRQGLVENVYEPEFDMSTPRILAARPSQILTEDFKEVYIQPRDLYKQRHNTTFKPSSSDYNLPTRSYLV
ncbi:tetraspanin-8-like [Teleopsis dalmanni]|uniref:tetraspanin-8-like n=1 Tax=Teleopsis dalmanni TaxID=139649 RepID=UPI0018CE1657|nr:tetraspanin-8-like [Teleopsis dalmanni]